jgi:ABC-type branched-subunit amino acid transport system substrate-binding protein
MPVAPRWARALTLFTAATLTATACGTGGEKASAEGGIKTDKGVTADPCPEAVNADNGCIYLGILADITDGPFAALGVEVVAGQRAFWQRVNEDGGIAGYDVDVDTYTRDNKYNPQEHIAKYREIEPHILALAQTLGSTTTLAALELYIKDGVFAVPATQWSGWADPELDQNVILESGQSYCIESMNGLDWYADTEGKPASIMSVGFSSDIGSDGAAGAKVWAEANDVEYKGYTQVTPTAQAGNQDGPVQAILDANPDVVQISTGPTELGEIVGKAVARGYKGQFIGTAPTWNAALLKSQAAPALQAQYTNVAFVGSFGNDTPAHQAMQKALGDGVFPKNDGFTWGWTWSYALKALLEAAADKGDLTRQGLADALDGLQVDYEGLMPPRSFTGDPNETIDRAAVISRVDPATPLGLTQLKDGYTGPTAEAFKFTRACKSE